MEIKKFENENIEIFKTVEINNHVVSVIESTYFL